MWNYLLKIIWSAILVLFLCIYAVIKLTEINNKHNEHLINMHFKYYEHIKALEYDNQANAEKKEQTVLLQKILDNCSIVKRPCCSHNQPQKRKCAL